MGLVQLLLAVFLAAAPAPPGTLEVIGVPFLAPGFEVADRDADDLWLTGRDGGLEMHVAGRHRAAGALTADEVPLWLGGLVEEAGFRLLEAEERRIGDVRVFERVYGDNSGGYRTRAGLLVGATRTVEVTLLEPPETGPPETGGVGKAAFRAVLDSLAAGLP